MYILFEAARAEDGKEFYNMDCMGYCDTEEEAMAWRAKNPEYREYKYCQDKKIE